ncbi:MAG TPA: hypothetical protein V6D00_10715 [Pantanalinema sp.]
MSRSHPLLAGILALGATSWVLVACSAGTGPGSGDRASKKPGERASISQGGLQPRDYYFPTSARYRATYVFTSANDLPAPFATESSRVTGTTTFETSAYAPNEATVRSTTRATDQDGQTQTQTTASTLRVQADGTVASNEQGLQLRYSAGIFTPAGAEVVPASGSEIPALRVFWLGDESVSVPAGTYQAVHLGQQVAAAGAPITHFWLAPGVGLVRQIDYATYSIPVSQNALGVATTSFEMRLESLTP